MEHLESLPPRRTFLKWLTHGIGAVFAVVLGAPVVAYLMDPLNRPKSESGFRTVDGVRKSELQVGQPKQGVIRNVRSDAWTLHPNDVVGRVWIVKEQDANIKVFSTVCPHLGCSINADQNSSGFTCPCHGAKFDLNGGLVEEAGKKNPAPRGMDKLDWQSDPKEPDIIQVKYETF
jgi:Rieske Fe-S protein